MIINAPLNKNDVAKLKVGDEVLIDGIIYTARDQAHKKGNWPFDVNGQIVFYAGAAPGKDSLVAAIGPTTASRMDSFLEPLLKLGLKASIGKGPRSPEAKKLFKKYKAVYFIATGGTAALLGQCVKSAEVVAFPELGPEAILRLEVSKFPVIVAYDSKGGDLFEKGQKEFSVKQ